MNSFVPVVVLSLLLFPANAAAQENYEIQVYGYETVPVPHTMLELHTNLTVEGSKDAGGGTLGIVAGIFLSATIAGLLGWPRLVSMNALVTAVLFSTAVGIFFGCYPAGKAAKLDAIEALRFE